MKRFFGEKQNDQIIIKDDEYFHLKKVLRMGEGDEIIACINDEKDYYCKIAKCEKTFCLCQIQEEKINEAKPNKNIVLFQMMPKKEYFDNIIPKAIELGVSEIQFFSSKWTMVKSFKEERVETIVKTACKQCERSKLINVDKVVTFEKMIERLKDFDTVIFAYENETQKFNPSVLQNAKDIAIVIGNEAGFTDDEANEIKKYAHSISLGKRILRCDTAVVATLALVSILTNN